jgi:hypothetical protein
VHSIAEKGEKLDVSHIESKQELLAYARSLVVILEAPNEAVLRLLINQVFINPHPLSSSS